MSIMTSVIGAMIDLLGAAGAIIALMVLVVLYVQDLGVVVAEDAAMKAEMVRVLCCY